MADFSQNNNQQNSSCHSSTMEPVKDQTGSVSIPPAEDIFIPLTWGKIAARVWGPPNGRPVFAVHGWMDNAGTFDLLIPLLPKDLRIVCVDIPDHGLSSHYPAEISYNFLDSVPAVKRLAAHFQWEKFSFIGHSCGAAVAVLFAGIYPEMVDKMILLDGIGVEITRPKTMNKRLRKSVDVLLKSEASILSGQTKTLTYESAMERTLFAYRGSLDNQSCQILLKRGLTQIGKDFVFNQDPKFRAAPLAFLPEEDHLCLAKQVTAEILIVKAKDGPYYGTPQSYHKQLDALKTKSKRFQYVEVEGQHHVHLTHPARVASYISDFFTLV